MKYQNFSSDENRHFLSSEDTIFIFDCEDIKVATASVRLITQDRSRFFYSQISHLKEQNGIFKSTT